MLSVVVLSSSFDTHQKYNHFLFIFECSEHIWFHFFWNNRLVSACGFQLHMVSAHWSNQTPNHPPTKNSHSHSHPTSKLIKCSYLGWYYKVSFLIIMCVITVYLIQTNEPNQTWTSANESQMNPINMNSGKDREGIMCDPSRGGSDDNCGDGG